ncbi:MAG: hypothetical protein GX455_12115, partial [Phycisphaerae bacterium]|nr:hypothetical protein [Phycisphaerae bacterium]
YNIESGEVIRVSLEKVGNLGIDSSGDIIVWDEDSPITSSSDIYGFNLKTRQRFPIYIEKDDQFLPKISGDRVIWIDMREETGWISQLLKKEHCQIRGKIFRHWPGEEK